MQPIPTQHQQHPSEHSSQPFQFSCILHSNITQLQQLLQYSQFEKNYEKSLQLIDKLIEMDQKNINEYEKKKVKVLYYMRKYEEVVEIGRKIRKNVVGLGSDYDINNTNMNSQKGNNNHHSLEDFLSLTNIVTRALLQLDQYKHIQQSLKQQKLLQQFMDLRMLVNYFVSQSNVKQQGGRLEEQQKLHKQQNTKDKQKKSQKVTQKYSALNQQQKDTLNQIKSWLYPNGARYDKVHILNLHGIPDYRGGIAKKSIQKDEIIVFIPKSELITLELAKDNQICKELIEKKVELLSPKHTMLAIFLLEEVRKGGLRNEIAGGTKGNSHNYENSNNNSNNFGNNNIHNNTHNQNHNKNFSKFLPYLQILLPLSSSCFPINYTIQQLSQLISSPFLFQIREKVLDLKHDYQLICSSSVLFSSFSYTFKQYCWSRMMVGSRVFGVVIDGSKTEILVPFADMLNHKIPKETVWNYDNEMEGFYIQSLKNIQIGDQICDSYGKKCNSRFLLNYGFVLEQNDKNQICIKIQLDQKNDHNYHQKIKMVKLSLQQEQKIKQSNQYLQIFKINKYVEQSAFFQMMGFLRFKSIDKLQTLVLLQKISTLNNKQPQGYKPSRTPPTTIQIQIKIWSQLKNICLQYLKSYPTSIQQDQFLLLQEQNSSFFSLSTNMKNIIILRLGQKRLYKYYVDMADNVIKILEEGYGKAMEKVKDVDGWGRYVEKILKLMPCNENKFIYK